MKVTNEQKAAALEAAVRELCLRYPPCKVPRHYPINTTTRHTYAVSEEDRQQNMIHYASMGVPDSLLLMADKSGVPVGEVRAVVDLIYG